MRSDPGAVFSRDCPWLIFCCAPAVPSPRRFHPSQGRFERQRKEEIPLPQAKGEGRGFAGMDEERRREVARMGGRAAHQKGTAHEFSPEEAREAGRKGGRAVSQNREHMSAIGREGGESRAANHTRRTFPEELAEPEPSPSRETDSGRSRRIAIEEESEGSEPS